MDLKAGQIWKYKSNDNSDAYLNILKIETRKNQEVIHISVNGVASHLPVQKKYLEMSLIELVSSDNSLPDFKDGYNIWNNEFKKGNAGIFTMPVKDIIVFLKDTVINSK